MIDMAKIRVFSQPTCAACTDLKEYLRKKGVEFEDVNIRASKEAFDEMTRVLKVRVTPVLVIEEKKLIGFDPAEVDKFLAENQ